ncbi:Molybdopterin-guanine dinucleotide biosynthesis protein [Pyrodictium delaneyi]|uniref:Molybdopterin-guanine dinucleotide biosynthesis protein n=1 Tax=Pyrodictium delaneyi TaxID=1273541 RepID=A0A0P0N4A1_9CREN|nr:molybdopterin-guanine dinucleotide biosynthesis protein MobB [Pyrodictium delaneyi]ALL01434.1 Molybdopterin-guanine dinucleotide biosynthesis protein [Pyrodictium delaneyi]OWJ54650.1 hypothetical protein Pdsh_06420 [Pyrodictium delaneyi]
MQLVLVTGSGSNVGKTTFGTMLVKELAQRGLHVAVVKHVHHGVDYRVKDTGRYLGAGAVRVAAIGPEDYMIVERRRISLWEALGLLGDVDIVVVEGFREQIGEVIGRGGCVVYIAREPGERPQAGSERLVATLARGLEEALARVLGLLEQGLCRLREM